MKKNGVQESNMQLTSRIGEKNGIYKVVNNEKTTGGYRVTLKCEKCGNTWDRLLKTLHGYNLNDCCCERFAKNENKRVLFGTGNKSIEYVIYKTNFQSFLKEKLAENPSIKYDDFDKIWNAVGPKPQDTEYCKWYLSRKHRGRRNPNFTADNMEWYPVTTQKAIIISENCLPNSNHRAHVKCARRANRSKNLNEFVGGCKLLKNSANDPEETYKQFIGRKFKTFDVIDINISIKGKRTAYFFVLRCCRCGKIIMRPASKTIKNCMSCKCVSDCGHMTKNSSTASGSKIIKLKSPKTKSTKSFNDLDVDKQLLLRSHISEYTMKGLTPEFIELYADAALLSKLE